MCILASFTKYRLFYADIMYILLFNRIISKIKTSCKITDYCERVLYNHIFGQQDAETGMVCCFNVITIKK